MINRLYILKLIKDPKKLFVNSLYAGIHLEQSMILDMFDQADNILFAKNNNERAVLIDDPDYTFKFVEAENY